MRAGQESTIHLNATIKVALEADKDRDRVSERPLKKPAEKRKKRNAAVVKGSTGQLKKPLEKNGSDRRLIVAN